MIDQYSTLSEKFLRKGFWLYLFSFIMAPIWYIIKIILSGELTVSEVGILYGIISLIWLLSAFNDLGMTESLNYFIPKFISQKRYDKVKSILFYALSTQIITSLLIAAFFYLWADFIANNYFKTQDAKETLKVFSFFFIWINIFQTISGFFTAVQDTFNQKVIDFLRLTFTLFAVLYIFFWDLSSILNYSYTWVIWLYIWVLIAIYIFYKKYYTKYLKTAKIIIEKKLIIKIAKYAWLVVVWASAWSILWQIDMQMIIYILWTQDAWYYTNYLSIIWIPFMIIWPIFGLLFPIFSEMHSKWEHSKIKMVKNMFQTNFLVIWLVFNAIMFVFAEIIAYTLFWMKFISSWVILQYSVLFLVFNYLLQINFNILAGIWRVKERVKIIFIAIIFNFILNLILINNMWVNWASLATGIWWVLIWVLSEVWLWKKYKIWFDYKFLIKNILYISALSIFSYYFINPFFIWLSRWYSFWLLFIVAILWFSIITFLNWKEFRYFVLEVKNLRK